MRIKSIAGLAGLFLLFLLNACRKKEAENSLTRSFYMAVTPWPADFNLMELDNAYRFINDHCDMISHHFDEGIPYEEAFQQTAMPQELQNQVNSRKQKTPSGKKVLLSVAALNLTRHEKAGYYNRPDASLPDSIQSAWDQRPFSDTRVVTAYVNYISWLIGQLDPDYINFGVESNDINWNPDFFAVYRNFIAAVYAELKNRYPDKPFFLSFMVNEDPRGLEWAKQLLPYSEYLALSAYPYINASVFADGNTDPARLPESYFMNYINLAPDKPFVFAETAWIAEDLSIPEFSLTKKGSAVWQRDYLEQICQLCNKQNALFLVWFCHKDYDAAVQTIRNLGLYDPLFKLWQDSGLIDEKGNKRIAYSSWTNWMDRKKQ